MKLFVSVATAAGILAALAVPAFSEASRQAKPEPLTASWSMPQLEGSATIRPAGFEAVRPEPTRSRAVRVVYPGPTGVRS